MEVRITFRSEIYIKGSNLEQIRHKWFDMPLFCKEALDCNAEYIELVSAERTDDDSYSEVKIN